MANTLVQFRMDEEKRLKAVEICENLGIDLPTYLRMSVNALVNENGIPFSTNVVKWPRKLTKEESLRAEKAFREMHRISEGNGNVNMTLDEINAEIDAVRSKRLKK